jgi:hypothetical protein
MIHEPRARVRHETKAADTRYGIIILLKLMPVENMAIISEFSASFEVKNMTAINRNSGLNRLAK